jgi:CHASE3 domain sensor protein
VLATANELERLVIDLETGVRGFALTGEKQFLERLSAASPEQEQTARQIALAASAYLEQYAAPLLHAVRRGDPAAREVAATREGKQRVDAMWTLRTLARRSPSRWSSRWEWRDGCPSGSR